MTHEPTRKHTEAGNQQRKQICLVLNLFPPPPENKNDWDTDENFDDGTVWNSSLLVTWPSSEKRELECFPLSLFWIWNAIFPNGWASAGEWVTEWMTNKE